MYLYMDISPRLDPVAFVLGLGLGWRPRHIQCDPQRLGQHRAALWGSFESEILLVSIAMVLDVPGIVRRRNGGI
jgi:hypothetical protein